MKNIEIVTAHKVEISYPLASLIQRAIAALIDVVIIVLAGTLFFFFFAWIAGDADVVIDNLLMLFYSPFAICYTLASETLFNGQTAGKKALGIRVIKVSGERLEFSDYLIRWIFRVVDIWFSAASVAIIMHLSNEKRQRLGDILANTAVVQTQSNRNYSLEDVMDIINFKEYELSYPSAARFSEDQMLLIKEALERSKRHSNNAHKLALEELASKVAEKVDEPISDKTPSVFLKTLLRDYIFLTR